MLVKIIRNPAAKPFLERIIPRITGVIPLPGPRPNTQFHPRNQQERLPANMGGLTSEDFYYPADWTKTKFAHWVETIKKEFPVGTEVTLLAIQPSTGIIPFRFTVEEVGEIQKFVPWDRHAYEPAALLLRTLKNKTLYRKPPSVIRHLTAEEKALVLLQDTKPQGTA